MAAISRFSLGGGYTFLDATYQSAETVAGAGNSANNSALSGGEAWMATSRSLPATAFRSLRGTC